VEALVVRVFYKSADPHFKQGGSDRNLLVGVRVVMVTMQAWAPADVRMSHWPARAVVNLCVPSCCHAVLGFALDGCGVLTPAVLCCAVLCRLLGAEGAALSAGGNVLRLVGLYHAGRGPHTFFIKQVRC
jgi:hypothetical protein